MAVSTNLGLYLPTREDYISVSRDLSNNYEIIDESAGMLEKGIAIVVDGDTAPRTISSGDYLFIKNHSSLATGGYHATTNIANGAAVTSSNTAADSKGVTNAIKANIDSLNSKINEKSTLVTKNYSSGSVTDLLNSLIVDAYTYIVNNSLTTIICGGTMLGSTQYSAVITKYAGGNFASGIVNVGGDLYAVQYNANNQTITRNKATMTSA